MYRRRTFALGPIKCKKGLHDLSAFNDRMLSRKGYVSCRKCWELRRRRWYWAKQLDRYWLTKANDPVLSNHAEEDRD